MTNTYLTLEDVNPMNFASTINECSQRNQSKIIIALPTDVKTVELIIRKTLIGGYSLVNTSLAFDTNILMANSKNIETIKKK